MSKFNSDFTIMNFNDGAASFFGKIGPERILKG